MELPYRAEYAKSGRASCKGCKSPIQQGTLRLAIMVQSAFHDGKQPNWHHLDCFFKKARVKTVDDIEHYESIRVEDQDRIKRNVGEGSGIIVPDKKGKKRTADKAKQQALKDFTLEYAKSGRAMCRGCEQKILKDEIRISKKDFETEIGQKYGGQDMWHHVTCFAQLRSQLGYFESGDKLPGFKSLSKDDQAQVKKDIPPIKQEDVPVKKPKIEKDPVEKEARKQNKIIFGYRDELQNLNKNELIKLLTYNNQKVKVGVDAMLDFLADAMTFGALKPCSVCNGQLDYSKFGYTCTSDLDEWTKCSNVTKEPERTAFEIPKDLKKTHPFLGGYKYEPRKRVFKDINPSVSAKKEAKDEADGSEPKVKRALPALYDMEFVILGNPERGKDILKKQIQALGGKVVTKISKHVMAVISTTEMVEKKGSRISEAEIEQVHVVPEDFVDEAKKNSGKIPDLIIKKSICDWGSDPTTRLPAEPSTSKSGVSKSRSMYTKSVPTKVKMQLKGGGAVDPDSDLQDVAHVYQDGNDKYFAILSKTDVQQNKNSYYKLQLLKSDKGNRFWLFRSWGRIGTTIGGNKTDEMPTLYDAKKEFCFHYEEKTGNMWDERHNFQKLPGKFHPVDVDYGEAKPNLDIVESKSNLPLPVQDLIKMIFDVKQMEKLLLEFEIDTEKMPLGKLSEKQVHRAFGVLSELQAAIEKDAADSQLIGLTNKFYTFIPHNFGVDEVKIIRDADVVKKKIEMLDSLMELEIAYNLMKSSGSEHTVDSYYKQLRTDIDILPKDSEEFKIIQEYVKNTHAATHSSYNLFVEEVYTVKREGEERRFKPFRKLHNHKLLWHGSRVTNFAGILSQGLRIAPPEAPVTGYMFGKGIYFADMVSKSANYCYTDLANPQGLLLLCDVALGNPLEKQHADSNIVKPPKNFHSVKGVGRTQPDPAMSKTLDGIEVPLGTGITMPGTEGNTLLYNEFIVYDIAQVNVKYLLKLKFQYKY